ncbi:MAG: metallophosphoesterase [Planctomycetaceae bacterium]|nr:metallophosphoesterase [Planctomycetaceae bacterium]
MSSNRNRSMGETPMLLTGKMPVLLALAVCAVVANSRAQGGEPAKKDKLVPGVTWAFSGDGGKTFSLKELSAVASAQTISFAARGVFKIDKPESIGCLWLSAAGNQPGLTTGDYGEWSRPLVTEAVVTLNGKALSGVAVFQVYNKFVLDVADLVAGENVVTISGKYCNAALKYGVIEPIKPEMVLSYGGPEDVELIAGPAVGACGEDYFSVCARTNANAVVKLVVTTGSMGETPMPQNGKETVLTSARGRFHRFRVAIPKGTRELKYTMTPHAAAGRAAGKAAGPHVVKLPDFAGKSFTFAAVGASDGGGWESLSETIRKAAPDFVIHAGGMNCFPVLDGAWDGMMFKSCAPLVATVPLYAVRGCEEGGGPNPVFAGMIYSPTPDGSGRNWAQVFGDLLLIGLDEDAITDWSAGKGGMVWLESVLKASREKFIIVVSHYPGYGSGQGCRPPLSGITLQVREHVMPLLAKYKVTAMISSFSHGYERSEPTGDKGVTNISIAAAGTAQFKASNRSKSNNPFHVTWANGLLYTVWQVKDGKLTMRALRASGAEIEKKTFEAR